MTSEILGRDEELGFLNIFLDGTDRRVRGLVLEGEAGVGKSTLWTAGLASAEQRGFQVLSSRPAEAERGLPHVVLSDLLEGVAEKLLPTLSAPRRSALEAALLIDREQEYELDFRALAVAVRTCFQVLAEEQPLVLAVDDTQWVDASSESALAFAFRRLRSERILVLLARRLDEGGEGTALEEALEPDVVERLRVAPLSMGAIRALLQQRLARQFARPILRRLQEISGGNPFYALELARGLDVAGATVDSLDPFPVPESLERLVGARLAGLGEPTRGALLLVAAHGRTPLALLDAAGISANALEPAVAAQVVELSTGAVRFTHPLLASVLYQEAPDEERRGAHGRLAAVVDDPVERARHLALASDGPDEEVAAMLEEAAKLPSSRGASVAAAELADHALRLTPSEASEDRDRRTIAAARAHFDAGDPRRARALALELHARPGGRSAEALVLLSDIEGEGGEQERSIELRREALEAADVQPKQLVEIHQWLGSFTRFTEGAAAGDRHAAAALELAEAIGDDSLRAGALCALAFGRFRAGLPGALSQVEQAVQLATSVGDPRQRLEINFLAVNCFVWAYQLDRARTLLQSIDSEWSERDELAKSYVFWWLAMIELRSGRFPIAADYAERAREIQRQYKIGDHKEPDVWQVALIAAHRGELDLARSLTESNRPVTEAYAIGRSGDDGVLGLVELGSGRPAAAAAHFAAAEADRQGIGVNEPAMFWWRADYAEALIGSGRLDEAASLVEAREAEAKRLDRAAVLADMKRCRGLLAAARGDLDEALAELEYAVAQHEAVGDPFGRARALLALGTVRRRTRQKRSAREAITAALEGFESAGAAGWAEKARAELGTIGGRTRFDGLTPAEGRIAALVAEGRTNREVAAALFLTEHTVATALTRVYRKLGVRSRTELARLAQTQDADLAKT